MVIDEMNLNELESLELLQKLNEHLIKNNMLHIVDDVFNVNDYEAELHDLIEKVSDLEKENKSLEDDHSTLFAKIDEALFKIKDSISKSEHPDKEDFLKELINTLG